MKVFVAGATGAIGRRLVPMLVEAGHEVTGMTRSPEKVEGLRRLGAEPVVCDAFDADALREAVAAAAPEVVVHELTSIPKVIDPRRVREQLATNDRLRVEGTRNLVEAALAAAVRRIVAQSIAFAYAPGGETVKTEADGLYLDAPAAWVSTVRAIAELERLVTTAPGLEGLVLRYGFLYGPGTAYAKDGSTAQLARKRQLPIVGRGTGVFSFVHVDDAARATVLALDHGAPGIYNVVDDEPAQVAEWLPVYARALGGGKPRRVPKAVARLVAGPYAVYLATELRGASNAKAKRELGWAPARSSWRDDLAVP